jgi:hypothetical protein
MNSACFLICVCVERGREREIERERETDVLEQVPMLMFRCEKLNLAHNYFQECVLSEGKTLRTFKCVVLFDVW